MDKTPKPPPLDLVPWVARLMLTGARTDEILEAAPAAGFEVSAGKVREAINRARERFGELLEVDKAAATGTVLARLNYLLARSLQIQDYKTAFSIQNEITARLLSNPDVILGPDPGPLPEPSKGGQPMADIDELTVYGMAMVGATNVEIAQICRVDETTIAKRFPKVLADARANLRKKLRRAQLAKAMEGNPTMLIWLGKQMLGQKDRADMTSDDKPLPHSVKVILVKPKPDPELDPRSDENDDPAG